MYCAAINDRVNAAVSPGLEALRWHLLDNHYSDHATGLICRYVLAEGTLAGAPQLEPGDEAAAEAAYVDALPSVPADDPAWGDEGEGAGEAPPVGPVEPPDDWPGDAAAGWTMAEPYHPTPEDEAAYVAMLAEEDARERAEAERSEALAHCRIIERFDDAVDRLRRMVAPGY